jgi:hypothetical protein
MQFYFRSVRPGSKANSRQAPKQHFMRRLAFSIRTRRVGFTDLVNDAQSPCKPKYFGAPVVGSVVETVPVAKLVVTV